MLGFADRGKAVIYHDLARDRRQALIKAACKQFYRGTTWRYMRKMGWRAVKVKIIGRMP